MTGAIQTLQTELYTALTGDTTLMAIVSGVYDHVPEEAAFPILVMEDMRSSSFDTSSTQAEEIDIRLGIYSRAEGFKQVEDIMARIMAVLHDASLSLGGGQRLVNLRFVSSAMRKGRDGLTIEGGMRFRAVVEE